jgi:hypothetical protein
MTVDVQTQNPVRHAGSAVPLTYYAPGYDDWMAIFDVGDCIQYVERRVQRSYGAYARSKTF